MNRTKKFMYNTIATAIYQVIVTLVGLVTPKVLLMYYGSELNGLVSSINQFITYFSLVEAGIAGAAVYSLYKPLAQKDEEGVSGVASAAKKYYYQSGAIFTGLVVIMAIVYPLFVTTEKLSPVLVGVLVLALGAKGFLDFFTLAKYRVVLTADQKTYVVSIASSVYTVLQMIIIVVLSVMRANIVVVYTFAIVAIIVRSLILKIYVTKKYPYINYKAKPKTEALSKRWDALFLQVLTAIQNGCPVIIMTVFSTLTNVSIYTIYNMVLNGVNGVLSIFTSGVSASFGDIIVRKEKENLKKVYNNFEYAYYLLIAVVYAVSFIMLMSFITIYTADVTDANYIQPLVGFLFVLNGLLYNLKTPQGTLIISAGHYRETRTRCIIQAAIIVIGGVILAPKFGLVGVLVASCLSNLYRDIDVLFYVPRNITKTKVKQTLKNWSMLIIIVLISVIGFSFVNINPSSLITWVLEAAGVTIVTGVVGLIVAYLMDKVEFKETFDRIKGMLVKKEGT